MDPKAISSTDLRLETRDLLEQVKFKGERFVIETFGRPMAVLISFEDFLRVKGFLEDDGRSDESGTLKAD